MSLAQALELSDEGRFREACAALAPIIERGGDEAALASAYLVGWSVHVPELDAAAAAARAAANANGRARGILGLELVTRRGWRGRLGDAARMLERSLPRIAGALPSGRRGRMYGYGAMLQLAEGDLARAEEHAARAVALSRTEGDHRWEAFSTAALALVALERGQPRLARERIDEAERLAGPVRDVMVPATLDLVAGEIAMSVADYDGAALAYTRAVVGSDGRHRFLAPWSWASVAAAQAERGELEEARFALRRAREGARAIGGVTARAVELRGLHLALAEDRPGARAAAERALRQSAGEPALRRWRHSLRASCRARSTVLVVDADRRALHIDGERVSLARSPMQRRLLHVLLRRRRRSEARVAAKALLDELGIAAESLDEHDRAVARIHAATVRLRRAGLGDLLVHDGDGLGLHARVFLDEA